MARRPWRVALRVRARRGVVRTARLLGALRALGAITSRTPGRDRRVVGTDPTTGLSRSHRLIGPGGAFGAIAARGGVGAPVGRAMAPARVALIACNAPL